MKIRCDFCEKAEASIFCSADEAALCETCDRHVHFANKLASQHLRFSLLHPSSSKQSPLCDICQERRAFLFCLEDRAILCRECDMPIHRANELTKKHNRFLLTGVKLSTSSSLPSTSSSSSNTNNNYTKKASSAPNIQNINNCYENFSSPLFEGATPSPSPSSTAYNSNINDNYSHISDNLSVSTSSISEYLETIPGWRVDDFLDPSIATTDNFYL